MKRLKEVYILFSFLLISLFGFGQNSNYVPIFWRLMHIDGEVELYGLYSELYSSSLNGDNKQTNFLFSGKIELNTQSYFWHPNFLVFGLNISPRPFSSRVALGFLMFTVSNSVIKPISKRINILRINFADDFPRALRI